jgi:DNA helicase IV
MYRHMDQQQKDTILNKAREHVREIREDIRQALADTKTNVAKGKEDFKTLSPSDQETQMMLIKYGEKRLEELEHLHPSPYFVRCDVELEGESGKKSLYFAKFPFSEKEIYSWASPASRIRFEEIGDIAYGRPDGKVQKGRLLKKDQYMIVDGKILFLSTESAGAPRELVYQEHFSSRRQGFVLPEIVAQMEKAQDQVIRAHHAGPFVISGPAGSGKTTLALHRVAYLAQSPDTTHLYPTDSMIVFVQDTGTKKYFSQLLPELGIHNVRIATYSEWALEVLELRKTQYVGRYGGTERERDWYEYSKLKALRSEGLPRFAKNPFAFLEELYGPAFDASLEPLWRKQKRERVLDRVDVTALLMADLELHGGIGVVREHYVEQKNGKLKKKVGRVPLKYSLVVVDEFQNYLPEQLRLLKACADATLRSTVYVGDMAQQIQLGTIRSWNEIDEEIAPERAVKLEKVYRNTRNILEYIRSLGYAVDIPDGVREGVPVTEQCLENVSEEISYVKKLLRQNKGRSLGILAKDAEYLGEFRKAFGKNEGVHVFTMEESQGVEFDTVCIVGVRAEDFETGWRDTAPDLAREKQKILKDLLYVALTRAISELHVTGKEGLRESVRKPRQDVSGDIF